MPMIPQPCCHAGCARIGAIHSVVFGGFAAKELAKRLDDARPKLVVAASCGIEPGRMIAYKPLLDAAIDMVDVKPQACLIWQRPQVEAKRLAGRDYDWAEAVAKAKSEGRKAPASKSPRPIRSIFSIRQGTTGIPKGSCATMAAIWSRSHGRCPISTAFP